MPLPMQQPVKNWEMMNSTEISCKMTKGCEILPKKNFALEKNREIESHLLFFSDKFPLGSDSLETRFDGLHRGLGLA